MEEKRYLDPPSQTSDPESGSGDEDSFSDIHESFDWPLPPKEAPIQLKEALDVAWYLSTGDSPPPLPSISTTIELGEDERSSSKSPTEDSPTIPKYVEHCSTPSKATETPQPGEFLFDAEVNIQKMPSIISKIEFPTDFSNNASIPDESSPTTECGECNKDKHTRDTSLTSIEEFVADTLDLSSLSSAMSFGSGSCLGSIQAAIQEIRKEASHMDTVMVLDQLKTVQLDLAMTTKRLEDKTDEVQDLKEQLQIQEERLSSVQLERDLCQADTVKLKEDLRTCVDRMFHISEVAGVSSLKPQTHPVSRDPTNENMSPGQENTERSDHVSSIAGEPRGSRAPSALRSLDSVLAGNEAKAGLEDAKPSLLVPLFTRVRPDPVFRTFSTKQETVAKSSSMIISPIQEPSEDPRKTIGFGVSKPRWSREFSGKTKISLATSSKKLDTSKSTASMSPRRRRGTSPYPGSIQSCCSTAAMSELSGSISSSNSRYSSKRTTSLTVEDIHIQRRCGLFFRRARKVDPAVQAMRNQMEDLQALMTHSLHTSEVLRKRLATMTQYYESIIKRLQDQQVQLQADRASWQAERTKTLAGQRKTIDMLEEELRRRNLEISELEERLKLGVAGKEEARYEI